jgi:hypothetical protein
VTVRFGAPLIPPASPDDSRALRQYTRQIMQAIADLAGDEPDSAVQTDTAEDSDVERS